ncbi:MAG: 2-phosphosulfolactate phosphatase [Candidatus Nephrothrix sp. EaCA]|nr:MAG: 2-phosphosulfolactate phosphatase [Candidatus Nephrothrix sp. EaCA]
MKTIDVCLTPELLHLYNLPHSTVVVVDIFRATTCMVTALAHGAEGLMALSDVDACLKMKSQDWIIAGERDGKKIQGFDKGNSPYEYMGDDIRGRKIAFTTTNGTQAIEKSKEASEIIIGSFLNFNRIAKHLLFNDRHTVIVCAGWKGRVNMEDTLFAGALIERLKQYLGSDCDAPLLSQYLYNQAKGNMSDFLKDASHVQRLRNLGVDKDIEFCLQFDLYDVLPVMKNGIFKA